ncbi:MAG TPA: hypothetical protein VGB82_16440 [Alphaproteobacteria bacterium]
MKLTSARRRNFLRACGTLSLSAFALSAVSRGALAQGYGTGQSGGSNTTEGEGTRGGTNVTGSGPGGPRDRTNNNSGTDAAGTRRDPNMATGRRNPPDQTADPNDPDMNPHSMRKAK